MSNLEKKLVKVIYKAKVPVSLQNSNFAGYNGPLILKLAAKNDSKMYIISMSWQLIKNKNLSSSSKSSKSLNISLANIVYSIARNTPIYMSRLEKSKSYIQSIGTLQDSKFTGYSGLLVSIVAANTDSKMYINK